MNEETNCSDKDILYYTETNDFRAKKASDCGCQKSPENRFCLAHNKINHVQNGSIASTFLIQYLWLHIRFSTETSRREGRDERDVYIFVHNLRQKFDEEKEMRKTGLSEC